MSENRIETLIDECKRQEESCLYTSTSLFEWLKSLRLWKGVFVVTPIVLGGIAAWPLLEHQPDFQWLTGICALLAGLAPAIYKALDLDVGLDAVARHAHLYKTLQDRFRQAWRVTASGSIETLEKDLSNLMDRMDAVRESSPTAPERFFHRARTKIEAGHYNFAADKKEPPRSSTPSP